MAGMIEVVNKKTMTIRRGGIYDYIYIGRACGGEPGSILGNPFKIGRDGDRKEVIRKYKDWIRQRIEERGEVWKELIRLKKMVDEGKRLYLVCWCKPEPCHGDVIKFILEIMKTVE